MRTEITNNLRAMDALKRNVKETKCTLSSQQSTRLETELFKNGNDSSEKLTRAKFKELHVDLFRKIRKLVKQVLKDARVKKGETGEIVLVDGLTRFPKVQQLLKEYSGGKANRPRALTLMKPSPMVCPSKFVFSLVRRSRRTSS